MSDDPPRPRHHLSPISIIEEKGWRQITDPAIINSTVHQILSENPTKVADFRSGQTSLFNFFVGQVMKATRGLANPTLVTETLKRQLESPPDAS